MRILLINPGRREYLVKYFQELKKKYNFLLYLIDADIYSPSFKMNKSNYNFVSPKVSDKENFKKFLKSYIFKNKINVVFPMSEYELEILAEQKKFYLKRGVRIIISDLKIIRLCKNKLKCYDFLKKNKIKYPKIIEAKNVNNNLPIIKKEVSGNGSKNQFIINRKIYPKPKKNKKYFYQKYLNSIEIGIDILNDLEGKYLHSCAKKKIAMRSGNTDKAEIIFSKKTSSFAKKLSKCLKHVGVIDVDCIYYKNDLHILDINPRIGGGYPFIHEFGFNYIEKIIQILKGKKYKSFSNKYLSKKKIFSMGTTIYSYYKQ